MIFSTKNSQFIWSSNKDGLAIRFSSLKRYEKARRGQANELDQSAYIRMQMLAECGQADTTQVEGGIFISTTDAVRLDVDTRMCFMLPPAWPGGMRLKTDSVPQLKGFRASLGMVSPAAEVVWEWTMRGPILEVFGDEYLPTSAQYTAISAYRNWQQDKHDEYSNLSLLASLRDSWNEGAHIHLETYENVIVSKANELSVNVREDINSGDLILRPTVSGDFPEIEANFIEERIKQLKSEDERTVIRVQKNIVLLDPTQTKQARAIATNNKIPSDQKEKFRRNPSEWLANKVFPDIETEFSPRVTGIGEWKEGYFGAAWEESQDWFGKRPDTRKPPTDKDSYGRKPNEDIEEKPKETPKDPETDVTNPIVPLIIPNDDELGYGWRLHEISNSSTQKQRLNFSEYERPLFPHQQDAIRWLLGHAQRAQQRLESGNDTIGFGAGALLADDMGLGKTYSTLVFISEWYKILRLQTESEPQAILIVAPLSLLENWKDEIIKSYGVNNEVFTRVIVAQADSELHKVRREFHSKDVARQGEVIQYGLGFGDATERSIDYPGSCVLTTYQTLRKYRFSFAKAAWSAVIFDEAQHIKNPNAMQTIAAKALKGSLRIMLTGTPVENHLGDFWCILDTAEPGQLGSFSEFRQNWILKMKKKKDKADQIGKELRDHVAGLMLRRKKEEELEGLPIKEGDKEPIKIDMTNEQKRAYESVIIATQETTEITSDDQNKKNNRQLTALWQLRQVSLHPDLLGGGNIKHQKDASSIEIELQRSGKLKWLLNCLNQIKPLNEKVLIFCVQKKLQEALAYCLGRIYKLYIPVLNGDTKASSKYKPEQTRLGLIKKFSEQNGFGVCLLSPIAAGAGLNIVAANHVIHLERHWNPAREDQATDRVYRIGQKRPVKVYLPVLIHPELRSFDLVLFRLLVNKKRLQGALGLVPPEQVSGPELINELFKRYKKVDDDILDIESALRLSWSLYEALIGTIYDIKAGKVILTPGGSDHGCDIAVLDWNGKKENILIQCKWTGRDRLDSEVAVREIEGSRPFYEKALGVEFNYRCLHTTAKTFSRRTKKAARICGVELFSRSWLAKMLKKNKIDKATVIQFDQKRERVI